MGSDRVAERRTSGKAAGYAAIVVLLFLAAIETSMRRLPEGWFPGG